MIIATTHVILEYNKMKWIETGIGPRIFLAQFGLELSSFTLKWLLVIRMSSRDNLVLFFCEYLVSWCVFELRFYMELWNSSYWSTHVSQSFIYKQMEKLAKLVMWHFCRQILKIFESLINVGLYTRCKTKVCRNTINLIHMHLNADLELIEFNGSFSLNKMKAWRQLWPYTTQLVCQTTNYRRGHNHSHRGDGNYPSQVGLVEMLIILISTQQQQ